MEKVNIRGIYRHYKGRDYEVIALARDCNNPQQYYVIYKQQYGTHEYPLGTIWTRKLEDFIGFKIVDGKEVKRFTLTQK